jgi:hypothetical protein
VPATKTITLLFSKTVDKNNLRNESGKVLTQEITSKSLRFKENARLVAGWMRVYRTEPKGTLFENDNARRMLVLYNG